jgi:hypothetical protein
MMYSSASLSGVREKATLLNKRHGVKSEVLTAPESGQSWSVACGGERGLTLVEGLWAGAS